MSSSTMGGTPPAATPRSTLQAGTGGDRAQKPPSGTQLCTVEPGLGPRLPSSGMYTPDPQALEESAVWLLLLLGCSPHSMRGAGVSLDPPTWGDSWNRAEREPQAPRVCRPRGRPEVWPSVAALPPFFCLPAPHIGLAQLLSGRTARGTHPAPGPLTSGFPSRIRLQVQDAGTSGSSSQDLFQELSRQEKKKTLEEKEGPQHWLSGWSPIP